MAAAAAGQLLNLYLTSKQLPMTGRTARLALCIWKPVNPY